ncbi:MAG: D-alanyl-D-alanine carboxypeptidase [Candidatus Tokpelaia sp. JSC188]|nr:MAG: D-alanyl-D-alanine carboxypeptidase [Candidatus Tokpelaia sp. JSC188]
MRIYIQKTVILFRKSVYTIAITIGLTSAGHTMSKGGFLDKYAAIVIDANTGKTLYQKNANAKRYPASLTKMMTLYMFFEALQKGRISRNTPIPVSSHAASRPPTKLGFSPGQTIIAETAIKALIAKSANDVAAAIGEYLGGSEKNFARMMTEKARRLGMMNTNFINASGLPDPKNYSTARDIAILSLALREHFPQQYRLFNTTQFKFRNKIIASHNNLIKYMDGVDGIKTGYTNMSGFNLASSRRQGKKRIVAVVMGGKTASSRDAHMADLLERYMMQASIATATKTFIADRTHMFDKVNAVPMPTPKTFILLSEKSIAIPIMKNTISDHEYDSILLTALSSKTFASSAAPAEQNEIIINNPPIPAHKTEKGIDSEVTASNDMLSSFIENKKKEWVIQIASLASQNEADQILKKAADSMQTVLENAISYTLFFEQGEVHYYRARFSGFSSKQAAWNACLQLKKAHFGCYALQE